MEVYKNGILQSVSLNEYHVEPDGSIWEHVFHHDHPTDFKFASTNPFATGVYIDEHRMFNFNVCNKLSSWEILVIQSATDVEIPKKWRWVQSSNPLTSTTTTLVSRNTTGYESGTYTGLYRRNSSTYLIGAATWWGAIGAWTAYNGGIPGWEATVVTSGAIDVFVRIDNTLLQAKDYKTGLVQCTEFYEF